MRHSSTQAANVLFVHPWGGANSLGGGEVWILNLAQKLSSAFMPIVALHADGLLTNALVQSGVPVHHTPIGILSARTPWAMLRSSATVCATALQVLRLVRSQQARLIHVFTPEAALPAYIAAKLAHVPLVATIMNCGPFPALDNRVIGQCDRVVSISGAVQHDLQPYVPAHKLVRIPLGIDVGRFATGNGQAIRAEFGIPHHALVVGVIANLEPKKGHDVLLHAAATILRDMPDTYFLIAGSDQEWGAYPQTLKTLAHSLGIDQRVIFTGFRKDIPHIMAALDVFALPSRREAQGLVALEAMAAGKPIVASAIEGLAENIEHERTGLLVPPDDQAALAQAIIRLLRAPEQRRAMGACGQRTVARFSVDQMVQQNEAVYNDLLHLQAQER